MAKVYHNSIQWALVGLFKRMFLGDNLRQLQSEADHLIGKVDADDVAAAQQILIDEGHSPDVAEKITRAFMHMGLHKQNIDPIESRLSDDHILRRMYAEHAMIRCYVADLSQVTEQIDMLDHLTDVSSEFRYLSKIVMYFVQVKKHLEREDDLIFPYLKKYGWNGLSRTAREEHKRLNKEIDNLNILTTGYNIIGCKDFKKWLPLVIRRFCPLMLDHLSYEQEILWPIALVVIDDPNIWKTIGLLSNHFEY